MKTMAKGDKLPLAVEIEINSGCNLSCSYCPNSQFDRVEKGHMKVELYEKIMQQLRNHQYAGRISYHFYNEPTLSPNLEKFVQMTKEYLPQAKTNMYSNGILLDRKKVDRLFSQGLDKMSLTEHENMNLRRVRQIQSDLGADFSEKLRIVTHQEVPLTNRGGSLPTVGKKLETPLKTPCYIPECVLIITVQGHVVPCYEDFFQKNSMGNINNQDILEIWNSPRYVQFRQDLKQGHRNLYDACRDCNNYLIIN